MKDDNLFRSQQFVEQIEQRRDSYAQQKQASMDKLVEGAQRFQQAHLQYKQYGLAQNQLALEQQKFAEEQRMDAAKLSKWEIERQQANDELQYGVAIHQADMVAAQKRAAVAQADLAVAQAEKAKKALNPPLPVDENLRRTMLQAISMGINVKVGADGLPRVSTEMVDPKMREEAGRQLEADESRKTDSAERIATARSASSEAMTRENRELKLELERMKQKGAGERTYDTNDARLQGIDATNKSREGIGAGHDATAIKTGEQRAQSAGGSTAMTGLQTKAKVLLDRLKDMRGRPMNDTDAQKSVTKTAIKKAEAELADVMKQLGGNPTAGQNVQQQIKDLLKLK